MHHSMASKSGHRPGRENKQSLITLPESFNRIIPSTEVSTSLK